MAKAARNIGRRAVTMPAPVVANDSGVVANGRAVAADAFVTF